MTIDLNAKLADEARHILRTTVMDLDAFLSLSSDDRASRWRQFDRAAKFQLIALMLTRRFGDWSEEEIDRWIAKYDAKWSSVQALPASDLSLPPVEDVLALVKERAATAEQHGDFPGAGQLNRVRLSLLRGAHIAWHMGDLLIASVNTPGLVYATNKRGCTCANGRAGKSSCWHVCLYDLLIDMAEEAAFTADIEADRAAATALGRRLCEARRRFLEAA
jgi:hypothetical protein